MTYCQQHACAGDTSEYGIVLCLHGEKEYVRHRNKHFAKAIEPFGTKLQTTNYVYVATLASIVIDS